MTKISDIKNPWHVVKTIKDMPKKTGNILMKSDMGWTYVGWWDAHKRQLFLEACRNHYDNVRCKQVLDGKVDCYRLNFREDKGMCSAWCEIPNDNDDWE